MKGCRVVHVYYCTLAVKITVELEATISTCLKIKASL